MALSGTFTDPSQTAGPVVQVVNALTTAVATGTTVMPLDDTIPQNTEGDEYMTLAITPKSTSNTLIISVVFYGAFSAGLNDLSVALFQDSTANALAAISTTPGGNSYRTPMSLVHTMTAGTVSSTTFKVRAGGAGAGTTTFNGSGGARNFGAITKSSIVITEYRTSN